MKKNHNVQSGATDVLTNIFPQLDDCVDYGKQADSSGDWTYAYEEAEKLDALIDALDVADGVRMGTQLAVGVKNLIDKNWIGFAAVCATMFGIAVGIWKRHKKGDKEEQEDNLE